MRGIRGIRTIHSLPASERESIFTSHSRFNSEIFFRNVAAVTRGVTALRTLQPNSVWLDGSQDYIHVPIYLMRVSLD